MRSSAPWRGCAFESLTTPRSVATESAYRCGETNHDTATIRNIRARVVMAQKYRFSDFCKTDRGRGTGIPAEGLEPTRSCDHWILSRDWLNSHQGHPDQADDFHRFYVRSVISYLQAIESYLAISLETQQNRVQDLYKSQHPSNSA